MIRDVFSRNYFPLLSLVLIALILDLVFFSSTLEDAQITYRYSLRFSEGYQFGMWNRIGTPVEGFTTFLWMIYLSFFGPTLDAIVYASKFTSIATHLSIVALFLLLYKRYRTETNIDIALINGHEQNLSKAFLFTSITLATFLPLSWYATNGMETLPFIALICYVIFLPLLTSNVAVLTVLTILLVLIRPDGIMFALASPLYYWAITRKRKFLMIAVAAIGTFLSLTIFRYSYFGYMMPNTYYAKATNAIGLMHLTTGIKYFGKFFFSFIYLFIPIGMFFKYIISSKLTLRYNFFLLLLFGIAIYFSIIAKAGADNLAAFPMWRHALNVFPLIVFCTFFSVFSLSKMNGNIISSSILCLLFLSPLLFGYPMSQSYNLRNQLLNNLETFPNLTNDYNISPMVHWLKSISDENTIIASSAAGEIPLMVDAYHIDILGLNDEYIAHNGQFDPSGPIDSKTDMNYILSLRPDIIDGYMHSDEIIGRTVVDSETIVRARRKMNVSLISNMIFQNEYLIITSAPYATTNRIFFIRKDYYMKINKRTNVQAIPLTKLISAVNKL